ncbi:MAG: hypothetical protein QXQ93_01705 [Ignisphaera sp.]
MSTLGLPVYINSQDQPSKAIHGFTNIIGHRYLEPKPYGVATSNPVKKYAEVITVPK